MRDYPTRPPWTARLPTLDDFHGLPAPAGNSWESGQPVKANGDGARSFVLGARRRCWLCGYPLGPRVYAIFTETGEHYRYPGPLFAGANAMHRSCAIYSAVVCPFLRHNISRRRLTDHSTRGQAFVAGFNGYGLFNPPGHASAPTASAAVLLGYFDLAEELPANTCAANYRAAVAADAKLKFTTTPRLYWTDSPEDSRRLNAMYQKDSMHARIGLAHSGIGHGGGSLTTVGGYTYRLLRI
ncbi:hypothetical protein MYSE111917_16605 [Mycobacterium senriense]|uniref:Uncharacterized protein n=1 Tax=Mycobacterium senriense TaxID=2775496 RepID=A0ABM7SU10_9MYCO|nr:hypothetical protein [Mycobacterium senriense]BCZ24856.1 hypothetical protein MTY59_47110 [Mycobacterium senriense]